MSGQTAEDAGRQPTAVPGVNFRTAVDCSNTVTSAKGTYAGDLVVTNANDKDAMSSEVGENTVNHTWNGCKELSAESGMVDSAHTRFNESEPAGIEASLRCMEGNNGQGVMAVEAPGVSVDTSCMVESTGMTVPDAGNDRTNPRVGTSNNNSEVRKWSIRVDQNTRGNSEVTIRTSAGSKISDSIERSQQADGSLMAIAGGGYQRR